MRRKQAREGRRLKRAVVVNDRMQKNYRYVLTAPAGRNFDPEFRPELTPRQLLRLAGSRLPAGYARRLGRYRYGPGVFKLDWALDAPIPWAAPEVARSRAWPSFTGRSPVAQ